MVTGKPIPHRKEDSSHALVNSVEWLSPTVIAAGLKDSTIFLHDLRSGGTATRLQHPHMVSRIRRVDEHRLVVAGINSVSCIQFRAVTIKPNGSSSKCTMSASLLMVSSATRGLSIDAVTPRRNHTSLSPTIPHLSFLISTSALDLVFWRVVSNLHPSPNGCL